jgi:multiple sugar transport system permease protein
LTTTRAPTLPVLASEVVTDQGILWGQLGAISVVMIVPILLLAIFASKYLVSGLASGSVKG